MLAVGAVALGLALPAHAANPGGEEPQFTIQIVPKSPQQQAPSARPQATAPPAAPKPRASTGTATESPRAPRPHSPSQSHPQAPPSAEAAPSATSKPSPGPSPAPAAIPPASLEHLDAALAEQRAARQQQAQLQLALEAVREIVVLAAGPEAFSPAPYVFVDFDETIQGRRIAAEASRRKERELLLQMLKDHVQQVELQGCLLVETKRMYEYRFLRTARLNELDAYNVTYTRQDGGGFAFVLKSDSKHAVLYQQQRGGAQLSEHFGNEIVFHTTITDGMQAFVLKQRLQELINRCKLGDAYKAGADLPAPPDLSDMGTPMPAGEARPAVLRKR